MSICSTSIILCAGVILLYSLGANTRLKHNILFIFVISFVRSMIQVTIEPHSETIDFIISDGKVKFIREEKKKNVEKYIKLEENEGKRRENRKGIKKTKGKKEKKKGKKKKGEEQSARLSYIANDGN